MLGGIARRRLRSLTLIAGGALILGLGVPASAAPDAHPAAAGGHWHASRAHVASGLACPTIHLCVGVEIRALSWTTNPTATKPKWHQIAIEPPGANPVPLELKALSCPTAHFCLAVDNDGNTFSTTDPTGGKKAWHEAHAVPNTFVTLGAVSCSSATFCAMLDLAGNALTSTNPGAASPTWRSTPLDVPTGALLFGLSCAGRSLCAAVESTGRIFYTNDPAASTGAVWHMAHAGNHEWDGVACPTAKRCVVVGTAEQNSTVAVSNDPAAGSHSWKVTGIRNPIGGLSAIDCVNKSFCFALSDEYTTSLSAKKSAWHATASTLDSVQTEVSCPTVTRCFIATGLERFLSWTR
jgi:hypothetical protein